MPDGSPIGAMMCWCGSPIGAMMCWVLAASVLQGRSEGGATGVPGGRGRGIGLQDAMSQVNSSSSSSSQRRTLAVWDDVKWALAAFELIAPIAAGGRLSERRYRAVDEAVASTCWACAHRFAPRGGVQAVNKIWGG